MKRHPLRRTAQVVSAVIVAMICGQFGAGSVRAAAPDDNQVVIRYLNDPGAVRSFEIADALGLFKDIRIESKGNSHGGPETLAALLSGSIDAGGIATSVVINAIAGGAKILCVMPALGINREINSKFFVLDDSSIKAPQDLKNKSIAVNAIDAHLDYTIREYLRMHGLNRDDVKLVKVVGPKLDQILRERQADVVAVGAWQGPIAKKIAAEGGVRVLFTDYDVLGEIVLGNIVMNKTFIDQHPRIVKEFVTASAKAADWATEHPAEARKIVGEILKKRGDDPTAAAAWFGYGLPQHALYTDHDVKFWLDVLVREGKLRPNQFDLEDIATNKYNANAQLSEQDSANSLTSKASPARQPKFEIQSVAEKKISQLPPGPLFWRVENFSTLSDAQAAAGPTGLAAEVLGKAWLFTLGPKGGSSSGGKEVAEVGPVPPVSAPEYLLRINSVGGPPGAKTPVHMHPGSETFYVLSGELSQKSPDGISHVEAGQSVPGHGPGTAMEVSSSGGSDLHALVMFVVDATKPFSTPASLTSFADEAPPLTEQARAVEALVTKAAALIEKEGKAVAFTEFRKKNSEWLHGDTYLYAYDHEGNVLLNSAFPQREGTNIAGQKDAKGKPFQDEILQVAAIKGEGWVSYMFPKPGQSDPSEKWAYVKRETFDGTPGLIASGFYPK